MGSQMKTSMSNNELDIEVLRESLELEVKDVETRNFDVRGYDYRGVELFYVTLTAKHPNNVPSAEIKFEFVKFLQEDQSFLLDLYARELASEALAFTKGSNSLNPDVDWNYDPKKWKLKMGTLKNKEVGDEWVVSIDAEIEMDADPRHQGSGRRASKRVAKLAEDFDEDAIYKSWDIKFVDDDREDGSVVAVYGVLTAKHPKVEGLDSKDVGAGFLEVTKDEQKSIYLDFHKEAQRYAERMAPNEDDYAAEELHLEPKSLKVKDDGKNWTLSLGVYFDVANKSKSKRASGQEKPASKWDKLPEQLRPFGWATPARNIDGTTPIPWRVAYRDFGEDWLKAKFAKYGEFKDLYVESEPDTYHGANRLWVGLRDNRNIIDHAERMEQIYLILKQGGWPVLFDDRGRYTKLWIVDDLPRNVLRGKTAGSDPLRYVAANGRLLMSQDKNMRYAMMRQMFGMSTLQTDMLMNLYKQGTLQQEGPKVLAMWKKAAYEGNPDGKPIYPVKVDHGYEEPVSGGTSVIKDLVYTLRKEQGRTAAQIRHPDVSDRAINKLYRTLVDKGLSNMSKRSRFEEGVSVDVEKYLREHGNPEAADEWAAMNKEYGDLLKKAAVPLPSAGKKSEEEEALEKLAQLANYEPGKVLKHTPPKKELDTDGSQMPRDNLKDPGSKVPGVDFSKKTASPSHIASWQAMKPAHDGSNWEAQTNGGFTYANPNGIGFAVLPTVGGDFALVMVSPGTGVNLMKTPLRDAENGFNLAYRYFVTLTKHDSLEPMEYMWKPAPLSVTSKIQDPEFRKLVKTVRG